jgi:2-methylcitrate dehydratase
VQQLLHKVRTLRDDQFTKRYPQETPCRVVVELKQERALACEAVDWLGFFNRPMSWSQVREKFDSLAMSHTDAADRNRLAELISHLEDTPVRSLTACLATVGEGKRV